MLTQAERLFRDEVRDKKRAAVGVHSRKGKRGYVGKVLYTADILRGKEKRAYQKNGKVVSWNMYEEIMDYSMFETLSEKQQKKVLGELRDKFPNSKIQKKWGLHNVAYYDIVKKLGLTGKGKKGRPGPYSKKKKIVFSKEQLANAMNEVIDKKTFLNLDDSQRLFLVNHYTNMIDSDELCAIWGISSNTLYNYKWSLRKKKESGELEDIDVGEMEEFQTKIKSAKENRENEQKEIVKNGFQDSKQEILDSVEKRDDLPDYEEPGTNLVNRSLDKVEVTSTQEPLETPEVVEKEEKTIVPEVVQEATVPEVENNNRKYGTKLEFDGEYNKEQLKKKLLTLVELLEDDGRFYEMEVSFTEIQED